MKMKRIHLLLLFFIFLSIAAKVSVAPAEMENSSLAAENNEQKIEQFFKYKVNPIQSYENRNIIRCRPKATSCCQV